MAKFPSLGSRTRVPDILRKSPEAGIALMEMYEEIMRGESALTEGERELIAAYVPGSTGVPTATASIRRRPCLRFREGRARGAPLRSRHRAGRRPAEADPRLRPQADD